MGISFLKWYKRFFNINHILFIGFLPENIWLRNWLKNLVLGALVRRWWQALYDLFMPFYVCCAYSTSCMAQMVSHLFLLYNALPVSCLTVESMPVVGTVHEVTGAAHSHTLLLIQCWLDKVYLLFPNVDGMCDHLYCTNLVIGSGGSKHDQKVN